MNSICILDVPVLHRGYLEFFQIAAPQAQTLYLFDNKLLADTADLHTEIRAIEPRIMQGLISSLSIFNRVEVLNQNTALKIRPNVAKIITAREDISERLVAKLFPDAEVITQNVFLRWDATVVNSSKTLDDTLVSTDAFDRKMMTLASKEGARSSCWWRAVGAILVQDRQVALAEYNHHVPSAHTPYADGDPRDMIEAGTRSELSTSIHAEQSIIAEAAKRGIALEGATLYVTVFPCPICAKLVAYSGIKKLYFSGGHASLDGESILRANKIKIVRVQ
ncbi:hypothetical protein HYW32_04400 [Candidatus Berkelbacteria bacterium]|nr:hypothetical protein [Candidatus Berkelbacteria bacterium]